MKNMSLRLKLGFAFLFVGLLVTGATVYTIYGVRNSQSLLDIVNKNSQRIQTLRQVRFITVNAQLDALKLVNGTTPQYIQAQASTVSKQLKSEQDELHKQIAAYRKLETIGITTQSQQEFDQIESHANQVVQNALAVISTNNASQRKTAIAQLDMQDQAVRGLIDQVLLEEQNKMDADTVKAHDTISHLTTVAWVASSGALVVAMCFGLLMAESLTRRIARLRQSADSIAGGNLAAVIETRPHDEVGYLGTSLNNMAMRLRDSYGRLSLEKQRDETMLQNMGEGLLALDEQGQIALINDNAAQLLGLDNKTDVIGKIAADVITLYDKDGKPVPHNLLPGSVTLLGGQTVSDVFTYQTQAKKVLINVTSTAVILHDQIAGVILLLRDVTKEKEIDRMKTEFISLASHQLRTPLSAIKWFSEMLVSGDAGELTTDQKDFAKNISDSTERMIDLVNSLLNISRIESGRIIVDPKPTDLNELVSGIVNDLKAKTEERQQTLVISVHSDLPKINLDPRLIGQVYMNLLTNAIKYTPKQGEISVFVSKKDDQLVSQVSDNGYGIPKEQQARIFQKFFRAENVAKHETDGTGLGLYLIKAIVESSGGKIWFESEENKGTSFWFSLPLSGMKPKEGEVTLDA